MKHVSALALPLFTVICAVVVVAASSPGAFVAAMSLPQVAPSITDAHCQPPGGEAAAHDYAAHAWGFSVVLVPSGDGPVEHKETTQTGFVFHAVLELADWNGPGWLFLNLTRDGVPVQRMTLICDVRA